MLPRNFSRHLSLYEAGTPRLTCTPHAHNPWIDCWHLPHMYVFTLRVPRPAQHNLTKSAYDDLVPVEDSDLASAYVFDHGTDVRGVEKRRCDHRGRPDQLNDLVHLSSARSPEDLSGETDEAVRQQEALPAWHDDSPRAPGYDPKAGPKQWHYCGPRATVTAYLQQNGFIRPKAVHWY